jgi:hypothetical protein
MPGGERGGEERDSGRRGVKEGMGSEERGSEGRDGEGRDVKKGEVMDVVVRKGM